MPRLRNPNGRFRSPPPTNVLPIIQELLEAQKKQGISDAVLLRRAGYSEFAMSGWRTGKVTPRIHALTDLAEVLGLELRLVPFDHPTAAHVDALHESIEREIGEKTASLLFGFRNSVASGRHPDDLLSEIDDILATIRSR